VSAWAPVLARGAIAPGLLTVADLATPAHPPASTGTSITTLSRLFARMVPISGHRCILPVSNTPAALSDLAGVVARPLSRWAWRSGDRLDGMLRVAADCAGGVVLRDRL